ncbi:hypothetical protein GLAREA_05118 [Glarea lozoyensis ATCC 20868]|uniref:Uncharacterized protein n=1 Tax=Glarea lozoyensis (strain ATCC 20868 / MF5171) TaxID=1116229 RepID=S3DDK2_GLAL2|nr:uncharacterized protein GLAREA_05118 [Glarea lozoyensis ATCC 20868]EPE35780.1 hypothetical protein GLAREA_05118 [Glarea lozoyensis ATCC 20868]
MHLQIHILQPHHPIRPVLPCGQNLVDLPLCCHSTSSHTTILLTPAAFLTIALPPKTPALTFLPLQELPNAPREKARPRVFRPASEVLGKAGRELTFREEGRGKRVACSRCGTLLFGMTGSLNLEVVGESLEGEGEEWFVPVDGVVWDGVGLNVIGEEGRGRVEGRGLVKGREEIVDGGRNGERKWKVDGPKEGVEVVINEVEGKEFNNVEIDG